MQVEQILSIIKENLTNTLQKFVFEPNNEITQRQLTNTLSDWLDSPQNDKIIKDFKVVCDATNNPPSSVDQNRLVVDLFIQPNSINTIFDIRSAICFTGTQNELSQLNVLTKEHHYEAYERAMAILGGQ